MNRALLALIVLFSIPSFADDGWDEIFSKEVKTDSCSSSAAFSNLFSLSLNQHFSGAAHQEYISEVNENSFFHCPKQFIMALQSSDPTTQAKVLNNFGVVHEPQELSAVLAPLSKDPQVGSFINSRLGGYVSSPKP